MSTEVERREAALSRAQRKMAIKVNLEQLLRRPPADWCGWSVARVHQYQQLARMVHSAGEGTPFAQMVMLAERLAELHGVPVLSIDPGHGSAS